MQRYYHWTFTVVTFLNVWLVVSLKYAVLLNIPPGAQEQ